MRWRIEREKKTGKIEKEGGRTEEGETWGREGKSDKKT